MSGHDWTPLILVFLAYIMWRLDRLGKQIEAVRDNLLIDLGSEKIRSETLRDREWEKKERKKDARQFWIFWGVKKFIEGTD